MRLQEIMETTVDTVRPDEAAERAWERMRQRRIHHLVVTQGPDIIGVVSERDLGGRNGGRLRQSSSVRDLMTSPVVTARPTTTVRQAANLMRGRSVGCLPVVDGKRLAGLVTVTDLLDLIGRGAERPVATTKRWVLARRGARRRSYTRR